MLQPLPFRQLHDALRKAESVLIVSDGRPDGDSLGSTTALYHWLKREGKYVRLFCIVPPPSGFLFLDGIHDMTANPDVFNHPYDVVITCDTTDAEHCGISEHLKRIPQKPLLAEFDHHNTNAFFGDINLVDTSACSTCEVVYRFFEAEHIAIDDKMATSLLTGLCTDTSHFSNAGTTAVGMEAAGNLCAAGARQTDILKNIVRNKTIPALRLWGTALERLKHIPELNLAVTYFKLEEIQKTEGGEEAVAGVSNFLNAACAGVDTIIVLKEIPDGNTKASVRSLDRDISILCKKLGGGGHKKAAGFTVPGKIKLDKNGVPEVMGQISTLGI